MWLFRVECGRGVWAYGDEERSELVVGGVGVASGDSLPRSMIPLMASVGCVAGSGCVEVGVEGVLPLAHGLAQASDFGDGTRW